MQTMKKRILLIATGGTIASKKTDSGLAPLMGTTEILDYVPSLNEMCTLDTIQIMNIDSTNMAPTNWLQIVATIKEHYSNYDGFVILHGTDTMSYTAAALSYLIQNSRKPIILTGSQRPIGREVTDAITNITDSVLYACDQDSGGVCIVFGGKVILGTRARKVRTKSFNAFDSLNYPDIALIRDGKIFRYIKEEITEPVIFYDCLNTKVFLLKLIPGMSPELLEVFKRDYDCLIIESFGVGGLPTYDEISYEEVIKEWLDAGKIIIMTTQVPQEGSDLSVYHVGAKYKDLYHLIESYDMTMEATVTKMMWITAQTMSLAEVEKLFYTPVNRDILY